MRCIRWPALEHARFEQGAGVGRGRAQEQRATLQAHRRAPSRGDPIHRLVAQPRPIEGRCSHPTLRAGPPRAPRVAKLRWLDLYTRRRDWPGSLIPGVRGTHHKSAQRRNWGCPMSSPLARYHQATRSSTAAALLYQIAYWWPRAKVTRNGHTWIAKSAKAWCDETGLTPDQYERAVHKLRRLRLVVTEQHWFGGKVITHLRLTRDGKALLEPKGQSAEPGSPKSAGPGSCKSAEPQLQGTTNKNYGQEKDSELALADSPGEDSPKGDSGKDMEGKGKDVLEKIYKPKSHMTLEALWRDTIAEVEGTVVPSFTNKQRGQLRQFASKCPPGKAEVVLEYALRHWLIFTTTAKLAAGLYKTPADPHVGFLLKHVGIAVNRALPKPKPKAKPAALPLSAAPKPPPKPVQVDYAPPPTWEEAYAFFYPPPKGG
jgi:hypothetical protein